MKSAQIRPATGVVAALCITLLSTAAVAAPPLDELPPKDRDAWQRLLGLEAGIAAMHCVQPVSAAFGEIEFIPKHYVAIAGCGVYGLNTIAIAYRQKFALWVNVIGPAVGLTSVLGGWALNAAGVIEAEIRPDVPQVMGGFLQLWAWIDSVRLLSRYHKRGESMLRWSVLSDGKGVQFVLRW